MNFWYFQKAQREELIGGYTIGASILNPQDVKTPRHWSSSSVIGRQE